MRRGAVTVIRRCYRTTIVRLFGDAALESKRAALVRSRAYLARISRQSRDLVLSEAKPRDDRRLAVEDTLGDALLVDVALTLGAEQVERRAAVLGVALMHQDVRRVRMECLEQFAPA